MKIRNSYRRKSREFESTGRRFESYWACHRKIGQQIQERIRLLFRSTVLYGTGKRLTMASHSDSRCRRDPRPRTRRRVAFDAPSAQLLLHNKTRNSPDPLSYRMDGGVTPTGARLRSAYLESRLILDLKYA